MASYFAMTRLAEMAGCRWYMPGPLGEIMPARKPLTFAPGRFEEVPAVWSRFLTLSGGSLVASPAEQAQFHRWLLHNRQYGVYVHFGHIWATVLPAKQYFQAHPEWYALNKGKRVPEMLCTSNEEMTAEFIKNYRARIEAGIKKAPNLKWFSISQDDGINFCECANCTALDPGLKDPILPNLPQITDRLVNFYNKVVTELVKDYPDKYFCFIAYVNSATPPVREKLHPHLMPIIAPITFSRYHAMNATNSETMQALRGDVEGWAKASKYIAYYGYAYNLGDVTLPYTRELQTRYDVPFLAAHGLGCMTMETMPGWQNLLPYYYLLARMNLDPNLDADALLADFYRDFFGPAAADMKAYMDLLKNAYSGSDYEMGGWWVVPRVFTPKFMKNSGKCLASAEKAAGGNEVLEARIRMWRVSYDSARLVLRMRERVNDFDFSGAADSMSALYALEEKALGENQKMVSGFAHKYWWPTFWKKPVDFCAETLRGAKVLFKFPDEWYAFVDYSGIGAAGRLYAPEFPLSRWIKLKTYTQTIGEQGYTRFRGTIWYRQDFDLGREVTGNKVHLLFAGVDDMLELYVNGRQVGRKQGGHFDAFDFDVSEFVRAGRNTVVCAVSNLGVTELETGGIMRPVVLYSPQEPVPAATPK